MSESATSESVTIMLQMGWVDEFDVDNSVG